MVVGWKAATVTTPPAAAATRSTSPTVCSAIAKGVTLARATISAGSTGWPWKSVKTDMPSCVLTSASAPSYTRSRPRRVAASAHCPPM